MKIKIDRAIVVEGRDDVDAVSKAVEALIIPTHGFGITAETWALIEKASQEKGLIILTDPDFSGEEIRRKLTARFPDSVQAYVAQDLAIKNDDIGIENSRPEVIAAAIEQAISNSEKSELVKNNPEGYVAVTITDLVELGLSGDSGASELRQAVCAKLGIGYGNAKALVKKLDLWGIGYKELEQTIQEIKQTL